MTPLAQTRPPVRLLSWGARLFYAGPSFPLGPHRNGVGEFCMALDGRLAVRLDPPHGSDWVETRSVFVAAGVRHAIRFDTAAIACLYVDPASEDAARLTSEMRDLGDGVAVGHVRDGSLADAIALVCSGAIDGADALALLARAFGLPQPPTPEPRVARVIEMIRERPGNDALLAELAAGVGLSPSRLRHAFKEATGVPVRRYRLWTRVGAAMREARRGASLTEAAHAAGFASSAHFSAAFRGMFGMAPSTFLRESGAVVSPT